MSAEKKMGWAWAEDADGGEGWHCFLTREEAVAKGREWHDDACHRCHVDSGPCDGPAAGFRECLSHRDGAPGEVCTGRGVICSSTIIDSADQLATKSWLLDDLVERLNEETSDDDDGDTYELLPGAEEAFREFVRTFVAGRYYQVDGDAVAVTAPLVLA